MRIERLDPRLCLSIDPVFDAGVLTVTGSPEADAFAITDNGRGVVHVEDLDSGERWEFRQVHQIIADAKSGDDLVRFVRLAGPAPHASVDIRLGEGADTLRSSVNLGGEVTPAAAAMQLDVSAGEGDDEVGIGLLLPAIQKVRTAAARVHVDLDGGNDRFHLNSSGVELVGLDLTAGEGNDSVVIGAFNHVPQLTNALAASAANLNVDLGIGNNRFQLNSSGIDETNLDLTAGDGEDAVLIGLLLPAVQKVHDTAGVLKMDLGDGNNTVRLNAPGVDRLALDLSAGDGADRVLIGMLLPAIQKVREAAARMNVDLGGGNDQFQFNTSTVDQLDLSLTAGGGEDSILIGLLLPAVQKVNQAAARMNIDLGGDDDHLRLSTAGLGFVSLDLSAGEGDDEVVAALAAANALVANTPSPAANLGSAARLHVGLGAGNDRFDLHTTGLDHVGLGLTAGDGDDNVLIGMLLPAIQKVRESAARMNIDLGGGNDHLRLSETGYKTVGLSVNAGAGDDELGIGLLLPTVQKVSGSIARVRIDLGPGSDHLRLRIRGYETVEKEIIDDENDVVDE